MTNPCHNREDASLHTYGILLDDIVQSSHIMEPGQYAESSSPTKHKNNKYLIIEEDLSVSTDRI